MHNIMDPMFSSLPHIDYYRAMFLPDVFTAQRKPRLENWLPEDLEAYCGIYSKETT